MNYIQLDFPLSRPHCGLPMANGNLGILIWGDKTLNLTVNRSDFWDHRGGENIVEGTRYDKLAEFAKKHGFSSKLNELILSRRSNLEVDYLRPQRIPVGRFELNFGENVKPVSIRLDYETGEATVSLSDGAELRFNISLRSHVVFIDDPGRSIREVHGRPSWEFRKSKAWLSRFGFQPPELLPDGWKIICPDPADGSLAVCCTRQGEGYVLSTDGASDNREETLRNNRIFWKKFWSDVPELDIPDPFYAKLFRFNIYKFAAATHPNGSRRRTSGALARGVSGSTMERRLPFQCERPDDLRRRALAGQMRTSPATVRHDRIRPVSGESPPQCQTAFRNRRRSLVHPCGRRPRPTMRRTFLRLGARPPRAAHGPRCCITVTGNTPAISRFCGNGRSRSSAASCADTRPCWTRISIFRWQSRPNMRRPTVTATPPGGIRHISSQPYAKLAQILVELSGILELPPEKIWLDVLERLPEYTLVEGYDASSHKFVKRIGIWEGQDLANCHRHHSHLACLYPFDSLPENLSTEQEEILETSIDHWIAMGEGQWSEWCYPWAFILLARMGINEAPMVMMDVWRKHFINEGLCTVYLPRFRGMIAHRRHDIPKPKEENEIMQLDGAMGFISAMIEMSAYKKGSTIYLFRGIPSDWKDYSFRNLPLPGGYRVSARRGGEIVVTGPKEETLRVHADGKVSECRVRPL